MCVSASLPPRPSTIPSSPPSKMHHPIGQWLNWVCLIGRPINNDEARDKSQTRSATAPTHPPPFPVHVHWCGHPFPRSLPPPLPIVRNQCQFNYGCRRTMVSEAVAARFGTKLAAMSATDGRPSFWTVTAKDFDPHVLVGLKFWPGPLYQLLAKVGGGEEAGTRYVMRDQFRTNTRFIPPNSMVTMVRTPRLTEHRTGMKADSMFTTILPRTMRSSKPGSANKVGGSFLLSSLFIGFWVWLSPLLLTCFSGPRNGRSVVHVFQKWKVRQHINNSK